MLPCVAVLSLLASDQNGPGVEIGLSIALIIPYLNMHHIDPNLSIPVVFVRLSKLLAISAPELRL